MTEAQIQKLNDRELLVRTYGKVEKIEGKLEIYVNRVNDIEKKQNGFVTKKSFRIWLGIAPLGIIALISLIMKLAKMW